MGALDAVNRPPLISISNMPPMRLFQDNFESRYDGGVSFGRHTLRWGVLVNVIRMNWFKIPFGLSPEIDIAFHAANEVICGSNLMCYPVTSAVIGNGLGYLTEVPTLGFPYGGAKNTREDWYVVDSWRANPRLNINFGLRYAYDPGQSNPDLKKPALLDQFMPGLARSDRRDKNNFAPHLGIAWDPTGSGKWMVRAGAGMFYDTYVFNATIFARREFLPRGIAGARAFLP